MINAWTSSEVMATPEVFKRAKASLLGARRVTFLSLLTLPSKLNCWSRVQNELSCWLAKGTVPFVLVLMFPPVVRLPPVLLLSCAEATAAARAKEAMLWKRILDVRGEEKATE